jgi:hypothetical protein
MSVFPSMNKISQKGIEPLTYGGLQDCTIELHQLEQLWFCIDGADADMP